MNKSKIITFFSIIIIIFVFVIWNIPFFLKAQHIDLKNIENIDDACYDDILTVSEHLWDSLDDKKGSGWKPYKRWEHFWKGRLMPDRSWPDELSVLREWQSFKEKKQYDQISGSIKWKALGPFQQLNVYERYEWINKNANSLGRVNIIRFHPENPDEIWAGASTGGVWRSYDNGNTWNNIDFTAFLSLGVSDIAFSKSNPRIVYVATGDYIAYGRTYSIGVIKSTDGGSSWEITNLAYELKTTMKISRLCVDPANPDIVLAATSLGIYKTTDGGGIWKKKQDGNFKAMMSMPDNPEILNAATYSTNGKTMIYRSTDKGDTWSSVLSLPSVIRTVFATTKANPDNIYAVCSKRAPYSNFQANFHSIIVSTDKGETWEIRADYTTSPNILGRYDGTGNDLGGQGWYDLCIGVSPLDENEVFAGGINLWKSTDGGYNWEHATSTNLKYQKPYIHVDQHFLTYRENSGEMFVANDGGIYSTTDQGETWAYRSNGMSITQFYRIGCDKLNPDRIAGGCQDNGTRVYSNGEWYQTGTADGMECMHDYSDPSISYSSKQYGNISKVIDDGDKTIWEVILSSQTTNEYAPWVTEFTLDPVNPEIIYAGHSNVWKSTNGGDSWKKMSKFNGSQGVNSIVVAPSDPNVVYACTQYKIYRSTDGGGQWIGLITDPTEISYIAVSHDDPLKFWFTYYTYNTDKKVKYFDGQQTVNLSGNLPNVPVNTIVVQKDSPDRIYIGTDIGVFTSKNNSGEWESYGSGMPNVIVNELEIQYKAKKLRAGTYGMGLWEADILFESDIEENSVKSCSLSLHPNPFPQFLIFNFQFSKAGHVSLKLYDMLGNEVAVLVDGYMEAGRHEVRFDGSEFVPGVFFYVMRAGERLESGKVVKID